MQLNNLTTTFKKKKKKKIGRGMGSGHGKTSCKGSKGQKSRKGFSSRAGFEGGQMPLYRKIPKRGFNNARFREEYFVLNVAALNDFAENIELTRELLIKKGVLSKKDSRKLKILGSGELKKKLNVLADKFSESAKTKITAAGGTWKIADIKEVEKKEDKE